MHAQMHFRSDDRLYTQALEKVKHLHPKGTEEQADTRFPNESNLTWSEFPMVATISRWRNYPDPKIPGLMHLELDIWLK